MFEAKNLSISFGGLKAVDKISFKIGKNEIYGLIGPNGAGKTTVFNLITGVYKPTFGSFYLDGEDLTGKSQRYINKQGIARTFQNIRLFNDMSVIRNVLTGINNDEKYKCTVLESVLRLPRHFETERKMRERAKELLSIFSLENERNSLAKNLSYGKQRKLEIARALATNPKLLLLDEPAAGMNPMETKELMNTIKFIRDEFDMTILLIEHDLKFVSKLCDRVSVLNFGTTLVKGKAEDALKDEKVIEAYIGTDK